MNALRKLERDFILADHATVEDLLGQLGEEDVMTRFGLEARLDELKDKIAALDDTEVEPTASAALFFGGRPVVGGHGIECEFGGEAVANFQDLVSKVLASRTGSLGERGIVPNKELSTLHITNVARGSFGFLIEEVQSQGRLVDSRLKAAVDQAGRLLDAFREPDGDRFQAAVEMIDRRVLETARNFFDLMRKRRATLRMVTGDCDSSFTQEDVSRAAERATSLDVRDLSREVQGQLKGVLPDAHRFEFSDPRENVTIRGDVDPAFTAEQLADFNRELVNVDGLAKFVVKRVLRNGEVLRENFTLVALEATDRD